MILGPCLAGPYNDLGLNLERVCADLDGDCDADLADLADFQRRFGQ